MVIWSQLKSWELEGGVRAEKIKIVFKSGIFGPDKQFHQATKDLDPSE